MDSRPRIPETKFLTISNLARSAALVRAVAVVGVLLLIIALMHTSPVQADNRKDRNGGSVTHYHWNQTSEQQEKWNGARDATGDRPPNVPKADWAALQQRPVTDFPNATKQAGTTAVYNCHGFTFANSEVWIDDGAVQGILTKGYNQVAKPFMVGDVVIYKDGGSIIHSGKVTTVNAGQITEVESKWGTAGRFKHAPGYGPYGAVDEVWRRKAGPGLMLPESSGSLLTSAPRSSHPALEERLVVSAAGAGAIRASAQTAIDPGYSCGTIFGSVGGVAEPAAGGGLSSSGREGDGDELTTLLLAAGVIGGVAAATMLGGWAYVRRN